MSDMLQEQLVENLQQLANTLGIAVNKLMEWGMLQVQVEIYQSILMIVIASLFICFTVKFLCYVLKKWNEICNNDTECFWIGGCSLISLVAIIMLVCGISGIENLIQYIINPEYSAFKIIIEELSNFIK